MIDGLGRDYEDVVYGWAKAGASRAQLGAKTAEQYKLSPEVAARLVDLVLERGALDAEKGWPPAMVDGFVALSREHPDADLALVEAAKAVRGDIFRPCKPEVFQPLLERQPDSDGARLRIFDGVWCLGLLTERTTLRSGDTRSYLDMAARSQDISDVDWLQLAILRIADRKASNDPTVDEKVRADVRRRLIEAELDENRVPEALALLPAEPNARPELLKLLDDDARANIAAAWWTRGDTAKSRAWLATLPPGPTASRKGEYPAMQAAREFHRELLRRALDPPGIDQFLFLAHVYKHEWSFGSGATGVWNEVFDRVAAAQGYPGLIGKPYRPDKEEERRKAMDACYRCAPELLAMVDSIAASVPPSPDHAAREESGLPAELLSRVDRVMAMPRPAWSEHPVPVAQRTSRKPSHPGEIGDVFGNGDPRPAAKEAWMKSLPEGSLVRYEVQGQRIVALTASQSLDPTGEVSAGGYWLSVSDDGGAHFAPPLYTGLRMYEPYVVLANSKLSMLEGDQIRLEVAVRKLDDEHIILPPVALGFLESRDDVYIEATLGELSRDSDGDGLTDLAEWAMLLSPDLADTDGDGIDDGRDALPLVAARSRIAGADAMAFALNKLLGDNVAGLITTDAAGVPGHTTAGGIDRIAYNAASTRFFAAPPAYFGGLWLNSRVIVLDDSMLERLSKARGRSFATGITNFELSHDGNAAVIKWSMGWAGGAMLLTRKGDSWEVETLSSWIT